MTTRRLAVLSGLAIITMAILAGFSLGYALPTFYPADHIDSVMENIINNHGLYRDMLVGLVAILVLDILVSLTLYRYFKDDSRKISFVSGALRIVYTFLFGVAIFYLSKNTNTNDVSNQEMYSNYQLFQSIWSVGLIIFGFHLILIGILMKWHKSIPKILWYMTLIAGVSYITVHLLKLTNPNSEFVDILEMTLALPMAIGEVGLAIWLLARGGKKDKTGQERNLTKANV